MELLIICRIYENVKEDLYGVSLNGKDILVMVYEYGPSDDPLDSCIGCDGPSPDSLLADRCSTYRGVPTSAHAAMRSVHNSGVLFSQIHTAGFALSPAHWE